MSKSYAILAGIEGYTLTKKKFHDAHEKLDTAKEKIQKFHITEQQDAKANGD